MVDRYLSTTFGINLLNSMLENGFYIRTDGRRTHVCAMTVALLCSGTKQS